MENRVVWKYQQQALSDINASGKWRVTSGLFIGVSFSAYSPLGIKISSKQMENDIKQQKGDAHKKSWLRPALVVTCRDENLY